MSRAPSPPHGDPTPAPTAFAGPADGGPTAFDAYAILYGHRDGRRDTNFQVPVVPDGPMPLDYYVWLVRAAHRTVLVDTGFSAATARRRDLQMLRDPLDALGALGVGAADVQDVILTHAHDDHAGNVDRLPRATIHLQDQEMAFATGRYMAHPVCGGTVAREDVHVLVDHAFDGRIVFHRGDAELEPGLSLHLLGGHTPGLQCVRVWTRRGWLVLASDATHFYENLASGNPYRELVDVRAGLDGFDTLRRLASAPDLIVPGHDPLVMARFPAVEGPGAAFVVRLV